MKMKIVKRYQNYIEHVTGGEKYKISLISDLKVQATLLGINKTKQKIKHSSFYFFAFYHRELWHDPVGLRTDLVGDWTYVRFCFPMTWPVMGDTGSWWLAGLFCLQLHCLWSDCFLSNSVSWAGRTGRFSDLPNSRSYEFAGVIGDFLALLLPVIFC